MRLAKPSNELQTSLVTSQVMVDDEDGFGVEIILCTSSINFITQRLRIGEKFEVMFGSKFFEVMKDL